MPLVQDHSCSECTKPYKPLADEPEIEDASPVKMVVMDGIVMGPVVALQFLFFKNKLLIFLCTIALCIW